MKKIEKDTTRTPRSISLKEIRSQIQREGEDILQSERFKKGSDVTHHKNYSVAFHSLNAARYAVQIANWLARKGVRVNLRNVIRGSLLHDIGMTEDQVHGSPSYRKAYSHPKASVEIAKKEFEADEAQCDAIRRHMWPVCIIPPKHIEGWIILAADKCSSILEVKDVIKGVFRRG